MSFLYTEYFAIFIFIIIAIILSVIIFFLSYFIATQQTYSEKISAYECGFDPFDDARSQFDIRFYLVAILFLIFDLEASFVFPWAISLNKISSFGFWSIIDFIIELIVGYIYVWKVGALEWELLIIFAEWRNGISLDS